DATFAELCENTTELTEVRWPSSTRLHTPVSASQIRIVLSYEADTTFFESCENITDLTEVLWPSNTRLHSPVSASQIRIVLS
ncbi:hypothetical protein BFJ67_g17396, partial [Fusarium oxysporum f. sp. cepae]